MWQIIYTVDCTHYDDADWLLRKLNQEVKKLMLAQEGNLSGDVSVAVKIEEKVT